MKMVARWSPTARRRRRRGIVAARASAIAVQPPPTKPPNPPFAEPAGMHYHRGMGSSSGGITPQQFVEKWSRVELSEHAASHEHFLDPCRLLGQPAPADQDATGAEYALAYPKLTRRCLHR
jgi:hypothetical protein